MLLCREPRCLSHRINVTVEPNGRTSIASPQCGSPLNQTLNRGTDEQREVYEGLLEIVRTYLDSMSSKEEDWEQGSMRNPFFRRLASAGASVEGQHFIDTVSSYAEALGLPVVFIDWNEPSIETRSDEEDV